MAVSSATAHITVALDCPGVFMMLRGASNALVQNMDLAGENHILATDACSFALIVAEIKINITAVVHGSRGDEDLLWLFLSGWRMLFFFSFAWLASSL